MVKRLERYWEHAKSAARYKYINVTLNIEAIYNIIFTGGNSMFISLNDMGKLTSEELNQLYK